MVNTLSDIGRQWDKQIVPVLQQMSVGRRLIPVNRELSYKGIGNTSVKNYGYKSTASAITDYNIRNDIADHVDVGDSTILIPIQQDMEIVKRRTFESMKYDGITVDADRAKDMAQKLSLELDEVIIQGWKPDGTNYETKGFYQIAGNSHAGFDFGTYGNAIKTVAKGLELLQEDNIYSGAGYNLVIAPAQYFELISSQSSTGIRELPQVLEILNTGASGQPGQVVMSPKLSSATGFMAPTATEANSIYFDLIEAQVPKNSLRYDQGNEDSGDIILQQIGAAVPRFKHISSGTDPSVCKFTAV